MTDNRANAPDADHSTHERLIQRVLHSLGPANDAGQALNNISFAQRIVAALIALDLIKPSAEPTRAAPQQDQPKKEDAPRKNRPDPVA